MAGEVWDILLDYDVANSKTIREFDRLNSRTGEAFDGLVTRMNQFAAAPPVGPSAFDRALQGASAGAFASAMGRGLSRRKTNTGRTGQGGSNPQIPDPKLPKPDDIVPRGPVPDRRPTNTDVDLPAPFRYSTESSRRSLDKTANKIQNTRAEIENNLTPAQQRAAAVTRTERMREEMGPMGSSRFGRTEPGAPIGRAEVFEADPRSLRSARDARRTILDDFEAERQVARETGLPSRSRQEVFQDVFRSDPELERDLELDERIRSTYQGLIDNLRTQEQRSR